MNDVSVIRVSRCGITRGTLYGKHVLTLIWVIMTGGSFKIVSNWAVLTSIIFTKFRTCNTNTAEWNLQFAVRKRDKPAAAGTQSETYEGKSPKFRIMYFLN